MSTIDYGQLVRSTRLELGMSQADLAEKAGVSRATVNKVENGGDPQDMTRVQLALALGKPAGWPDESAAPSEPPQERERSHAYHMGYAYGFFRAVLKKHGQDTNVALTGPWGSDWTRALVRAQGFIQRANDEAARREMARVLWAIEVEKVLEKRPLTYEEQGQYIMGMYAYDIQRSD